MFKKLRLWLIKKLNARPIEEVEVTQYIRVKERPVEKIRSCIEMTYDDLYRLKELYADDQI